LNVSVVTERDREVENDLATMDGAGVTKRSAILALVFIVAVALLSACKSGSTTVNTFPPAHSTTTTSSLPPGVMSAQAACQIVIGRRGSGFFTDVEQVHLVLTTYAKGEPVESEGDIASGMPPQTLVWVVEVHAKAINWNHSVPAGYKPPAQPSTDFSVVMNAKTGRGTDSGECRCWPLPLATVGTVVSLPPDC
jgi:hypothetical protein